MRIYVVALATGVLVGVIYGLLEVRSPAPPVVALIGLLGILIGEQVVPMAKRLLAREPSGTRLAQDRLRAACIRRVADEVGGRHHRA